MRRIYRVQFDDATLGYQVSDELATNVYHDDGTPALETSYTTIAADVPAPAWLAPEVMLTPVNPPPAGRFVFPYSFRARFTMAEKIAIEGVMADATHPMSMALRATDKDLQSAHRVDLNLDATRNGVLALEQAGIIGAGRALQILDAPITDDERA